MMAQDHADLDWLSDAMAAAHASPWEPRCITEAFLPTPETLAGIPLHPLTMRGWLALDRARSPFLSGEWAGLCDDEALSALLAAVRVLSGRSDLSADALRGLMTPEQAVAAVNQILGIVRRAFRTRLRMAWRWSKETPARRDPEMGSWLPTLTELITLGMSRDQALDCPVDQAYALIAGAKALEGAEVEGPTWMEQQAFDDYDAMQRERDGGRDSQVDSHDSGGGHR